MFFLALPWLPTMQVNGSTGNGFGRRRKLGKKKRFLLPYNGLQKADHLALLARFLMRKPKPKMTQSNPRAQGVLWAYVGVCLFFCGEPSGLVGFKDRFLGGPV